VRRWHSLEQPPFRRPFKGPNRLHSGGFEYHNDPRLLSVHYHDSPGEHTSNSDSPGEHADNSDDHDSNL
jgi:hypothetical protein